MSDGVTQRVNRDALDYHESVRPSLRMHLGFLPEANTVVSGSTSSLLPAQDVRVIQL